MSNTPDSKQEARPPDRIWVDNRAAYTIEPRYKDQGGAYYYREDSRASVAALEVERFTLKYTECDDDPNYLLDAILEPAKDGEWVRYADYERLAAASSPSPVSPAQPAKDLRIYDRDGAVVTQGALNVLLAKLDSVTEDAELAVEDADSLAR